LSFVKHLPPILLLILQFISLCSLTLHAQATDFRFNNIYKEDGLPSNDIKGTVKDKLGFLWIATTNGLCRYDAKGRIKVFQTDIENNKLH